MKLSVPKKIYATVWKVLVCKNVSIECGKRREYITSQQKNFKPVGWMWGRKSPETPSDLFVVFMEVVEWPSSLKICEFLTKG